MLKYSLCREALIKIYMSFIRPILEYGDIIWDNCSERDAALLEDVQVTAARIITGNCLFTLPKSPAGDVLSINGRHVSNDFIFNVTNSRNIIFI